MSPRPPSPPRRSSAIAEVASLPSELRYRQTVTLRRPGEAPYVRSHTVRHRRVGEVWELVMQSEELAGLTGRARGTMNGGLQVPGSGAQVRAFDGDGAPRALPVSTDADISGVARRLGRARPAGRVEATRTGVPPSAGGIEIGDAAIPGRFLAGRRDWHRATSADGSIVLTSPDGTAEVAVDRSGTYVLSERLRAPSLTVATTHSYARSATGILYRALSRTLVDRADGKPVEIERRIDGVEVMP